MNKESGNPSQTSSANQAPKPKTKSPRAESEITGFRASACHRALNRTFLTAAKWFCQLGLTEKTPDHGFQALDLVGSRQG